MGIGENVGENVGENTGTSGYVAGGLVHGQLSTVTGSGFGTRSDHNYDGYQWAGYDHLHYRFSDFGSGFPSSGSSQATYESTTLGFYPASLFSFDSTPTAVSIETGGPSQSGKYVFSDFSLGGNEEYVMFATGTSGPNTAAAYTCFKHKGAYGGKVARWWKDGGGDPNFYLGNGSGGTLTREYTGSFNAWLDNYGSPGASFRRYELFLRSSDSQYYIDGTQIVGTDAPYTTGNYPLVDGQTQRSVLMSYPNSGDGTNNASIADIYFDFTEARVEVSDGSVTEIQPVNSWSNTSITIIFNKGELSSGEGTLYIYDSSSTLLDSQSVTIS